MAQRKTDPSLCTSKETMCHLRRLMVAMKHTPSARDYPMALILSKGEARTEL